MKYTFSKNVLCGEYFKNTPNINFQSPVLRQNILCVDIFSENSAPGSCMFILYIYIIYTGWPLNLESREIREKSGNLIMASKVRELAGNLIQGKKFESGKKECHAFSSVN